MEEKRRNEDKNWALFIGFMGETTEFRKGLDLRLASIETQTKKTNGRVDALENRQSKQDAREEDKKAFKVNTQNLLMIICTVIMAVSAIVMCFKNK